MKLVHNKHVWKFTGLAAADGLMFGLTNAHSVSSPGLMVGFLLLVATLYYLANNLLSLTRLYGLKIKRQRRLAAVITGSVSGLVALQSIGGLNSLDMLVLVPLVIVGYVYSYYGKGEPSRYHQV